MITPKMFVFSSETSFSRELWPLISPLMVQIAKDSHDTNEEGYVVTQAFRFQEEVFGDMAIIMPLLDFTPEEFSIVFDTVFLFLDCENYILQVIFKLKDHNNNSSLQKCAEHVFMVARKYDPETITAYINKISKQNKETLSSEALSTLRALDNPS